jgi:hypothetical protein
MKPIFSILILAIFSLAPFFLSSQENDSTLMLKDTIKTQEIFPDTLPEIFLTDNILLLISKFLPNNWNIINITDTLIFNFSQPIFKIPEDLLYDSTKRSKTRFTSIAEPEYSEAKIVFKVDSLWSGSKMYDAKSKNSYTIAQIEKLQFKYKISHLMEYINSSNFDINSSVISTNERKSIKRYFEDKIKLENELIITPNFHTTNYSLFLISITPDLDKIHMYSPPFALQELKYIFELFVNYAGK